MAGLTNLVHLYLSQNQITDISVLGELTRLEWLELSSNSISDLLPLVANTGLGSGDEVDVRANPLSYPSINTHIPALQQRGVKVKFDNRADINNDGLVNVLDLIEITSALGNQGTNLAADVNRDGVINILDLVVVTEYFH